MTARVRWRVNVPAVTEPGEPVVNRKGKVISPAPLRIVKEATTRIAEGYVVGPVVLDGRVHLVVQGMDNKYHVLPLDELNA